MLARSCSLTRPNVDDDNDDTRCALLRDPRGRLEFAERGRWVRHSARQTDGRSSGGASPARAAGVGMAFVKVTAMQQPTTLSIVVPLYRDVQNLAPLFQRLAAVITELQRPTELVLVDDGSR